MYKQKYLKYKAKYLSLKYGGEGGKDSENVTDETTLKYLQVLFAIFIFCIYIGAPGFVYDDGLTHSYDSDEEKDYHAYFRELCAEIHKISLEEFKLNIDKNFVAIRNYFNEIFLKDERIRLRDKVKNNGVKELEEVFLYCLEYKNFKKSTFESNKQLYDFIETSKKNNVKIDNLHQRLVKLAKEY